MAYVRLEKRWVSHTILYELIAPDEGVLRECSAPGFGVQRATDGTWRAEFFLYDLSAKAQRELEEIVQACATFYEHELSVGWTQDKNAPKRFDPSDLHGALKQLKAHEGWLINHDKYIWWTSDREMAIDLAMPVMEQPTHRDVIEQMTREGYFLGHFDIDEVARILMHEL